MNEKDVISKAMSILGSRTSAAKKRSSRLNGKRPKRNSNPNAKSGKPPKIKLKRKVAEANG